MQPYSVKFNGYVLQNASFRTQIIQHMTIPTKIIQTETKSRADGLTLVNVKYGSREISVEGMMTAADRNTLVTLVDQMKLNLNGASGNLDIDYGNGVRRYYATVDNIEITEDYYSISQVPYKISFTCADPFGYATISGNVNLSNVTNLLNDILVTMSGSYDTWPTIQLSINTAVAFTQLTISNENTGENIIVSNPAGNFNNGDLVVIDSVRKLAFLNNSGIDYTGTFPSLHADTTQQRLRVAVLATSLNYNIVVQYPPKFL